MSKHDYTLHHAMSTAARDLAFTASMQARMAGLFSRLMGAPTLAKEFETAGEFLLEGAKTYPKPEWRLEETVIDGQAVAVTQKIAKNYPFMELVRFRRDTDRNDPKLLVIAPLSGHYATLLRDTVRTMLPCHDVYVTDWKNARDVPVAEGRFGFDDYVGYVQDAIRTLGPDTHIMAVCQPTVPTLAAVSLMAQANDPLQPVSMTMMAGPIDTRRAITEPVRLAESKDMGFFRGLTSTVPYGFKGAGRPVYPGHMQLTAFLAMNPDRHIQSGQDLFNHLRRGDGESADKIREFYNEYNAVLDLTAEFYLETIDRVFQRRLLARGEMVVAGQHVNPAAITRTSLLTVEGGKDDISAPGQTIAAHDLCSGLPTGLRKHLLHPDVGHYGTFSGRRFRNYIAPEIISHIRNAGVDNGLKYSEIPADTRPMPSNSGLIPGAIPA